MKSVSPDAIAWALNKALQHVTDPEDIREFVRVMNENLQGEFCYFVEVQGLIEAREDW
jgi:hypothetical protein